MNTAVEIAAMYNAGADSVNTITYMYITSCVMSDCCFLQVDASGECLVEYLVTGNKVKKSKSKCKSLEKAGQYHQANPVCKSGAVLSKVLHHLTRDC